VRQLIAELITCFANISAAAESLEAKLEADGESSFKADVEQIIQLAKSTEGKLSRLSRTCALLAVAPHSESRSFRKYGVELEEDLVTMIEDLIERQRQKLGMTENR